MSTFLPVLKFNAEILIYNFPYSHENIECMTACFANTLLMNTHKKCFLKEIRKIFLLKKCLMILFGVDT